MNTTQKLQQQVNSLLERIANLEARLARLEHPVTPPDYRPIYPQPYAPMPSVPITPAFWPPYPYEITCKTP